MSDPNRITFKLEPHNLSALKTGLSKHPRVVRMQRAHFFLRCLFLGFMAVFWYIWYTGFSNFHVSIALTAVAFFGAGFVLGMAFHSRWLNRFQKDSTSSNSFLMGDYEFEWCEREIRVSRLGYSETRYQVAQFVKVDLVLETVLLWQSEMAAVIIPKSAFTSEQWQDFSEFLIDNGQELGDASRRHCGFSSIIVVL